MKYIMMTPFFVYLFSIIFFNVGLIDAFTYSLALGCFAFLFLFLSIIVFVHTFIDENI